MNDVKLNFLHWVVGSKIPDEILKNSSDWKFNIDGTYQFKTRLKYDFSHWRFALKKNE